MSTAIEASAQGAAAESSDGEVVVSVQDLHAGYGDRMILKGVNLELRKGEILVIMGGSGSGKSTLLRHLLGLETPRSGRIRILGEDLTRLRGMRLIELRKKIGVAFQSGALFSSLTLGENVMLPLREHTQLDDSTMRIMMRMKLSFVNLGGCEHLMPAQLSGGMTKRAALARAIIMDPQLLFLDEPSAGLDPVVSAALDELILKLRDAAEMSIVVVTHELESAFKIADRICILDQGRVAICGTPDEVRASENERVQALLTRRVEEYELNPEEYLRRLTGDARPRGERS